MSKFGTLVFIRKPIPLKKGKSIHIQVGRTVMHIKAEDRLNIWEKCFCPT
jgi:hypothetical protein